MRFLLDTNIISNITKPTPSEALLAWMADQADQDLYISSLTVAEIRRGVLEKPAGKRRRELEASLRANELETISPDEITLEGLRQRSDGDAAFT